MAKAVMASDKATGLDPRQYLLLYDIDWASYRKISDALTENHVRLTYDRGVLELMSKSALHEVLSRLYQLFLFVLSHEHGLPICSCGSMTCDREDLERGLEPDECFYLVTEPLIRTKVQIDLSCDPPPDLAVEIDISRSSQRRLGIYAAIKVPEVWQVDNESLTILGLGEDGDYVIVERSRFFPKIPLAEIPVFAQHRADCDQHVLIEEFRNWVRAQLV